MTSPTPAVLDTLLARVRAAAGPDSRLDWDILDALFLSGRDVSVFDLPRHLWAERRPGVAEAAPFTGSLDAVVALVETVLPGFWQSSGLCSLTGHASIGPDYNGPHAERLRQEWPEERFHEGFHADLKPGDGRHRQCLALIDTVLQALLAKTTP